MIPVTWQECEVRQIFPPPSLVANAIACYVHDLRHARSAASNTLSQEQAHELGTTPRKYEKIMQVVKTDGMFCNAGALFRFDSRFWPVVPVPPTVLCGTNGFVTFLLTLTMDGPTHDESCPFVDLLSFQSPYRKSCHTSPHKKAPTILSTARLYPPIRLSTLLINAYDSKNFSLKQIQKVVR